MVGAVGVGRMDGVGGKVLVGTPEMGVNFIKIGCKILNFT